MNQLKKGVQLFFIIMLIISIIFLVLGKSYAPLACYFLIMASISEMLLIERNQINFKKNEQKKLAEVKLIHEQYYFSLQKMLLWGKVSIEEIPQELRVIEGRTYYVSALRYAREYCDLKSYLKICQLELNDSKFLPKIEQEYFKREVASTLFFAKSFFKENEIIDAFIEEQKESFTSFYNLFKEHEAKNN